MSSVHATNGRIGALESWAAMPNPADRARRTEAGRRGLLEKFERMVDPDGTLPEGQRIAAAEDLRRAHMLRLAQASARSRKKKQQQQQPKKTSG